MKKRILLLFSLIPVFAVFGFAQTMRTVTNADLEKFRQKREQAEAEYRATYKQRGLPSPEELAQREAERQKDLAERAARARELERREEELRLQQQQNRIVVQTPYYSNGQSTYYYNQQPFFYGGQILTPYVYDYGRHRANRSYYYNVQPHTQLSPLLPNVQINTIPTRIFTTPPAIIFANPQRHGGRGY